MDNTTIDVHEMIKAVWQNHKDETRRRDLSHWRGYGRWKDDDAWKAIGCRTLRKINNVLVFIGKQPNYWQYQKSILEWGPGGGANLYAFRHLSNIYLGVDISQANLDEATRMIKAEGVDNFHPYLLEGEPASIGADIHYKIDLFLSTAVFQHFPSKDYGAEVLKAIYQLTKKGGAGIIQIRFDNGIKKFKPLDNISQYMEKYITANSYGIDEFCSICTKVGFQVLYMDDIMTHCNYLTYALMKV